MLPKDLLQKISSSSKESSHSATSRPSSRFRQLMRAEATSDRSKDKSKNKDLFSLIAEDEEKKKEPEGVATAPMPTPLFISAPSTEVSAVAPSGAVAEIESLAEKMISSMQVLCSSGDTETSLFLNNPSSLFFGTTVTIREFSTAPKAFNIEIRAASEVLAILNAGKQVLLSNLEKSEYAFSVYRIETHLQQSDERPLFHRKEMQDDHEQDLSGGEES